MNDRKDDKDDKPDPAGSKPDPLVEIVSRLGGLLGQASDLVDAAKKLRDSEGNAPITESRVSMKTMDGEPFSFSSLREAFEEAATGSQTGEERPLRQASVEFVIDTPERLLAVADLPGVATENVSVNIDGDQLMLKTDGGTVDYWAETLLPRDVAAARREVAVINGILNIVWHFPAETT